MGSTFRKNFIVCILLIQNFFFDYYLRTLANSFMSWPIRFLMVDRTIPNFLTSTTLFICQICAPKRETKLLSRRVGFQLLIGTLQRFDMFDKTSNKVLMSHYYIIIFMIDSHLAICKPISCNVTWSWCKLGPVLCNE